MAVYTDLTFVLMAESLASCEYQDNAKNPTVASIAKIVTTTMSSAMVNPIQSLTCSRISLFSVSKKRTGCRALILNVFLTRIKSSLQSWDYPIRMLNLSDISVATESSTRFIFAYSSSVS